MSAESPSKGTRTRSEILDVAVDVASSEGLEGLTIGSLAKRTRLSKSGLYAHFGSKEELQLATVERAAEAFVASVIAPTTGRKPGIELLHEHLTAWCKSVEQTPYRGGCFFFAASAEFDGRPGAVRDRVATLTGQWLDSLEATARLGVEKGELKRATDCAQLAFECHALVQEANWARQLLGRDDGFDRARRGFGARLTESATKKGRATLARLLSTKE